MIRVTCDTCGAIKTLPATASATADHAESRKISRHQPKSRRATNTKWIIGYDLQLQTPRALSRAISFFEDWDDVRVLERGAIHFCSIECREAYVASNSLPRKNKKSRRNSSIVA